MTDETEPEAPEPTPLPKVPEPFTLADVLVTVDGGEAHTLLEWQTIESDAAVFSCTEAHGDRVFDFDDLGHPSAAVVYTDGRPD